MRALRLAYAFVRRDLLTEASYRANFLFGLAGGLSNILLFFFLSGVVEQAAPGLSRYRGGYFAFVLVGLAVNAFLGEALHGFARRVRQAQLVGTLEAVLAAPVSPAAVILAQSAFPLLGASMRAGLYLVFGAALFGASLDATGIPAAAAALGLGVGSFAALGILSASTTMVLKRGDPLAWVVGLLSTLLSGVYYPVEVLPRELQTLAEFLPTTHVLRALREALLGGDAAALRESLGLLVLFFVVLLPLSLAIFLWAVRRARREGSLTHF